MTAVDVWSHLAPMKASKACDGYTRPVQFSTVRLIITTHLIIYPFNIEAIYKTLVLPHFETQIMWKQ